METLTLAISVPSYLGDANNTSQSVNFYFNGSEQARSRWAGQGQEFVMLTLAMRSFKHETKNTKQILITMIYARVDDDNVIRLTCIADYQELKDWIAEGNTPVRLL